MTKQEYEAYRARQYTSQERRDVCMLEATARQMVESIMKLKARKLAGYKWVNRDIGLIKGAYNRIIQHLADNADPDTRDHIDKYCASMQLDIKYIPPNQRTLPGAKDMRLFDAKEMIIVIETAVNSHCNLCVYDDKACKACKLRKALGNVVREPSFNYTQLTPCGFANWGARTKGDEEDV